MKQSIISFFLVAVFCFGLSVTAYASEEGTNTVEEQMAAEQENYILQNSIIDPNTGLSHPIQPYWTYVISIGAMLDIRGNIAHCTASTICYPDLLDYSSCYMQLQKQIGSDWFSVNTWNAVNKYATNDIEEQFALTGKGSYRVWNNSYIYSKSGNVENVQKYTSTKTYS